MRRFLFIIPVLLICKFGFGQQNTILMHSFFKDRILDNSNETFVGSSFLPVFESELDLNKRFKDSSVQYYTFTEIIFKKHLFEAKGEDYFITISPILDLTYGKDVQDTNDRKLFQNTRGFLVEGDLFKNFSFSTGFFENQGRFSIYETNYYSSIGELYPNQGIGKYITQNGVIPGSGRTKPFKLDGFDYAYAIGNIVYKPHRSIILCAGNTSQFIGDGYRSILLSDNAAPAPFLRGTFKISKKWQFNYLRMRAMNLMRRPVSSSVEAYYETKGFSANYISYQPTPKLSISLFEGIIWSRGDSITSKRPNPLIYNPVPVIADMVVSDEEKNSVLGINLSFAPLNEHRFYGQLAFGNLNTKHNAFQLGYRGYNYFGLKNFMIQVEFNSVSKDMYTSVNERLNYSHFNLPMAHVKGNSFNEIIFRSNYEWNRLYYDLKSIYYVLKDYSPLSLLPVNKSIIPENGTVFLQQIELGYRINKKMNLSVFGNWQFRSSKLSTDLITNQFFVGLRTGINNHYNDF